MNEKTRPQSYFDGKAPDYSSSRSTGLLGAIVTKEKLHILKALAPRTDDLILDVGCGDGYYARHILAAGGKVIGIDISYHMARSASRHGIPAIVADVRQLPFKGPRFTKVLLAGVLEFVTDQKNVLRNIHPLVQKNGIVIILYPRKSIGGFAYKLFHHSHGVPIRLFSRRFFRELRTIGFTVVSEHRTNPICRLVVLKKI